MTATVTIKTYLDDDKKLVVNVNNNLTGETVETFELMKGHSAERNVFNGISITAEEVDLPKPEVAAQP